MRCTSKNCVNITQTKKRTIALFFLICFIGVSLLSGIFILTQTEHNHDYNGACGTCVTCIQIQNAENLLKQFITASFVAVSIVTGLFSLVATIQALSNITAVLTPVTLKIRMNN